MGIRACPRHMGGENRLKRAGACARIKLGAHVVSVGIKMAGAAPSNALDLSEFPPWLLDLAKWIL